MIEIWQPRYRDDTVLLAKRNITDGVNKITFTRAKHLAGKVYECDSSTIRSCPTEQMKTKSGHEMTMYVVPMESLKLTGTI